MTRQAVFLVGGKGTRLGPLTATIPKPLLQVGGRPFLDYLVEFASCQGIDDILFLAGHQSEQVKGYANELRLRLTEMSITVSTEPEPAGTAGALLHARDHLQEIFFLFNGDSLFNCDLGTLMAADATDSALARLALRHNPDRSRYGAVVLNGDRVTHFMEKGMTGTGWMNAGIYLMHRAVTEHIVTLPASLEKDVFPRLAQQGLLAGTLTEGYFIDIGIPEDFQRAQTEVPAHRNSRLNRKNEN